MAKPSLGGKSLTTFVSIRAQNAFPALSPHRVVHEEAVVEVEGVVRGVVHEV